MFANRQYGVMDYNYLLSQVSSFLSLDISKTSTGVTLYRDGELLKTHFSMKGIDDDILMKREFERQVKNLLGGQYVEYIIIEDTIGSINHVTARTLYTLNSIPDDLANLGEIQVGTILRPDNREWKSWLRKVSGYKSKVRAENHTKDTTVECIRLLGYTGDFATDDESDSFGMALGTIYAKVLNMVEKSVKADKKTKLKDDIMKGYEIKQFSTFDSVMKYSDKYTDLHPMDCTGITKDFKLVFRDTVNRVGDDKVFITKIKTTKLGVLILKYDLTLDYETSYLFIIKKGNRKNKTRR